MYEGLNMVHMFKYSLNNRHLLGEERRQRRKKKVVQTSHVADDRNSLELDLCVNSPQ